jgi:hypothetical protein
VLARENVFRAPGERFGAHEIALRLADSGEILDGVRDGERRSFPAGCLLIQQRREDLLRLGVPPGDAQQRREVAERDFARGSCGRAGLLRGVERVAIEFLRLGISSLFE